MSTQITAYNSKTEKTLEFNIYNRVTVPLGKSEVDLVTKLDGLDFDTAVKEVFFLFSKNLRSTFAEYTHAIHCAVVASLRESQLAAAIILVQLHPILVATEQLGIESDAISANIADILQIH